jgi:hypothetical protein
VSVSITDRAARPVGFDTFTDLGLGLTPTSIVANTDGTVTVTFPDPVDELTLALVRERMTTRDDDEMVIQRLLATLMAELNGTPNPTTAKLKDAVMLLGALALKRGAA